MNGHLCASLHIASNTGHIRQESVANECIRTLIDHGADVNIKDKWGWTSLHYVSIHGNDDCIITLLSNGAHVNIQNKNGGTPLYIASRNGRKECMIILIDHGQMLL